MIPVQHPAKYPNHFTILYKSLEFAFYKYFDKALSPNIEDIYLIISGFYFSMFIAAKIIFFITILFITWNHLRIACQSLHLILAHHIRKHLRWRHTWTWVRHFIWICQGCRSRLCILKPFRINQNNVNLMLFAFTLPF